MNKHQITISKRKCVNLDTEYWLTRLRVLGEKQVEASLIVNANPNIKWCPFWILNYIAKSTLLDFYANMKKKCLAFEGSDFEKKMIEKAE